MTDPIPAPPPPESGLTRWQAERARLMRCRAVLNMFGVLTEAENRRIMLRIVARYAPVEDGHDDDK